MTPLDGMWRDPHSVALLERTPERLVASFARSTFVRKDKPYLIILYIEARRCTEVVFAESVTCRSGEIVFNTFPIVIMPPKRKLRRNSNGSDASYVLGRTLTKQKPQGSHEEDEDLEDLSKSGGRGRSRGRGRGQARGRGNRGGRGGRGGGVEHPPGASADNVPQLAELLQKQTLGPRPPTPPGAAQPVESLDEDFEDLAAERVKTFWQKIHEEYDGRHRYSYSFLTGRSRRFPTSAEISDRDKNFKCFLTGGGVPKEKQMLSEELEFDGLPVKMLAMVLMIHGLMPPVLPVLSFRQIIILMNLLELFLEPEDHPPLPKFETPRSSELYEGFRDIVTKWSKHLESLGKEFPEEWISADVETVDSLVAKHSYSAVFHMDVPITHIIEHWYYELMERKRLCEINGKLKKQKQKQASGKTNAELPKSATKKTKKCVLDLFEKVAILDWNYGEHAPLSFEGQFDYIMEPLWISNELILSDGVLLTQAQIDEARRLIYKRAAEMNISRPFPTWETPPRLQEYTLPCPLNGDDRETIRTRYLRTNPQLEEVDPVKIANKHGFTFYRIEKITETVQKEKEEETKQIQKAKLKDLLLNQKFIVDFENAPKHPEEYTPIDWDKEREAGRVRDRMGEGTSRNSIGQDATNAQGATTDMLTPTPLNDESADTIDWAAMVDWDDPLKGEEIIYYHIEREPATLDFTDNMPNIELGNPDQNFTISDLTNLSR